MNSSLTILTAQPSVVHHYIAQLRDVSVQGDRMRFRRNMERIGEIMAYEVSKAFLYDPAQVTTPLGTAGTQRMRHPVVLTTVLRAALPLYTGFLKSYQSLLAYGSPLRTYIVAAIASRPGVEYVLKNMPECHIWAAAVDETLNHKYYIVPGLGDAGDLAFGEKK
jgi:uracil phosphoribosyltransferase